MTNTATAYPDVQDMTDIANAIGGIKLTNANEGTELYNCWRDRVLQVRALEDRLCWVWQPEDSAALRKQIAAMKRETNRYAI